MNYPNLLAEIGKPAYAAMSDDQIAAALQSTTVSGPDRRVPISDAVTMLRQNQTWYVIKAKAAAGDMPCVAAVDLVNDLRENSINMADVTVVGMLGMLVKEGILTQQQSDDLIALKNTTVPLLASIDCAELIPMDVGCVVDHMQIARGIDPQLARKAG